MKPPSIEAARAAVEKAGERYTTGKATYADFVAAQDALAELERQKEAETASLRAAGSIERQANREEATRSEAEARAAEKARVEAPYRRRLAELRAAAPPSEPNALKLTSTEDLHIATKAQLALAQVRARGMARLGSWRASSVELETIRARLNEPEDARDAVPYGMSPHEIGRLEHVVMRAHEPGASWSTLVRDGKLERRQLLEVVVTLAESGGPDLRPRTPTKRELADLTEARARVTTADERFESVRTALGLARSGAPTAGSFHAIGKGDLGQQDHVAQLDANEARAALAALVAELEAKNVDVGGAAS